MSGEGGRRQSKLLLFQRTAIMAYESVSKPLLNQLHGVAEGLAFERPGWKQLPQIIAPNTIRPWSSKPASSENLWFKMSHESPYTLLAWILLSLSLLIWHFPIPPQKNQDFTVILLRWNAFTSYRASQDKDKDSTSYLCLFIYSIHSFYSRALKRHRTFVQLNPCTLYVVFSHDCIWYNTAR